MTARDGTTVVLKSTGDNPALAVNHLDDSFSASAALVDTKLYLRGENPSTASPKNRKTKKPTSN